MHQMHPSWAPSFPSSGTCASISLTEPQMSLSEKTKLSAQRPGPRMKYDHELTHSWGPHTHSGQVIWHRYSPIPASPLFHNYTSSPQEVPTLKSPTSSNVSFFYLCSVARLLPGPSQPADPVRNGRNHPGLSGHADLPMGEVGQAVLCLLTSC